MVINENTSQINAFAKGMNSDTAYDQVDSQLYVYAKNVRITKNNFVGGDLDSKNHSSLHEGVISPVPAGQSVTLTHKAKEWRNKNNETIEGEYLGHRSIDNFAAVVTIDGNYLSVYKITFNELSAESELWWQGDVSKNKDAFKDILVSLVLYKELEKVIKLYIATGVYPIIEIRMDGDTTPYTADKDNVDYYINNRILPKHPVYINGVVDGQLKTSQVQYTYRYYNKFGTTTQLAPLTNKILVIDSNRSKETGNALDTNTSIGFTLKIRKPWEYSYYTRLLIYRLSYIVPGEDATVDLIYDGDIDTQTQNLDFLFNDVGASPLLTLTMEEFAAMSGMVIIPKIIEQNQQYLFAANIKDDTIIQNVTIDKPTILTTEFNITLATSVTGKPEQSDLTKFTNSDIRKYFESRNVNPDLPKDSYNNIFTSSLLRSLRRGELYNYGIVYYDKYGRHTNVLKLGDVNVKEIKYDYPNRESVFSVSDGKLVAHTKGVRIPLPTPTVDGSILPDVIGCQIVRRSSKTMYQKTLLQVALARPIRQALYDTEISNSGDVKKYWGHPDFAPNGTKKYSPYYPTGFLWSNDSSIGPGMYFYEDDYSPWDIFRPDYNVPGASEMRNDEDWDANESHYLVHKHNHFIANSYENNNLFLIFSSEIDFRRDDVMSLLKSNASTLLVIDAYSISENDRTSSCWNSSITNLLGEGSLQTTFSPNQSPLLITGTIAFHDAWYNSIVSGMQEAEKRQTFSIPGIIDDSHLYRWAILLTGDTKTKQKLVFPFYYRQPIFGTKEFDIKQIKDVKIPQWFDGFSNIEIDGTNLAAGGIKKYQLFNTNIDEFVFNNWVSSALYDCKISHADSQPNAGADRAGIFLTGTGDTGFRDRNRCFYSDNGYSLLSWGERRGWIGPGTSCFLMTIKNEDNVALKTNYNLIGELVTAICNIRHDVSNIQNEPEEFTQYFGFGNFFPLKAKYNENKLVGYEIDGGENADETNMTIFDGDIYITPQEISTMYKTYDFLSYDTLQSMLITNYVPMESKVNTFFDYGMNLLNTDSANLMTEPGSIEGVTTQDRPVHQYNQIYSANDESNDVFTLVVEDPEDNNFKLRTYYSEPKTNGEYVDNFVIFKPAAYIDVDPKYGDITNLLTDKNTLYYWQNAAFGKFSVNERSLINDLNGNTIMLGQAGILSRNDYISTKYGMRLYDFCATPAENGVYWVDVNNKAVVGGSANEAVNIGERLNVLNIINSKIGNKIPRVDYDLLNNELLCKCLGSENEEQLIFNLKFNIGSSIYTRDYTNTISIRNHIYGYNHNNVKLTKYNYLSDTEGFLSPLQFSFVVNPAASTTKVFDSLTLIPAKRKDWTDSDTQQINIRQRDGLAELELYTYLDYKFETDINSTDNDPAAKTDREGNIIYNIPRFGNGEWGNRLRGKWLKVDVTAKTPDEYTTISHVITKFRQSYS